MTAVHDFGHRKPAEPTPLQVAVGEFGRTLHTLALTASDRERAEAVDIMRRRLRREQDAIARATERRVT